MKILNSTINNFDNSLNKLLLQRNKKVQSSSISVTNIIKDVKKNGDKALLKYEKKFNQNKTIVPTSNQINNSIKSLDQKVKKAIDIAYDRIYKFHSLQKFKNISFIDKFKNKLEYKYLPIDSVAIYVPGSSASYPSSVLMNAVPAIVAGVKRLIMINPGFKGKQNPAVLYAARKCKIKEIYSIGGPSAVSAAAYGTKKIKKVDKIVGPGNAYVAEAKRQVFGKVGIDSIAGPSEVLIVCDKSANPNHVAIDLLSQAEHDELAQAILITDNQELALNVEYSVKKFLTKLPRSKIASSSWNSFGAIILVEDMNEAIKLVNFIAPEHLQLMFKNAKQFVNKIKNAGAIFLGPFTPEAVGDYIAGPNHVLPTNGTAKFSSGLGVLDFYKRTTIVNFNEKNLNDLGKHVVTLAKAEGLDAHAMSVSLRLTK